MKYRFYRTVYLLSLLAAFVVASGAGNKFGGSNSSTWRPSAALSGSLALRRGATGLLRSSTDLPISRR